MDLNWQGFRQSFWEAFGEIILHSLACLGILVLIIVYFKVFYCIERIPSLNNVGSQSNKRNNIGNIQHRYFNKFLLGSLILSFIYVYLSYIFTSIFSIILGYRWNHGCFIRNIVCVLIGLQRIVAYSFYIIRLNVTFKGSIFEISSINIKIILILLIITIIIGLIPTLVFAYIIKDFSCKGKYYYYYSFSGLLFIFIDLTWCIILSVLYIKKLRQLIRNVDDKCTDIRFIVHKLSVLAFVTVTSTLVTVTAIFCTFIWVFALMSIDSVVNNICIILSFGIFDESYQYYCCCCIKIQNNCCIKPNKSEMELQKDIQYNHSSSDVPKITDTAHIPTTTAVTINES